MPLVEKRIEQLASGTMEEYDLVGPVVLKFITVKRYVMRWCLVAIINLY